eukprot:GHRQ01012493.1.p2 GENE.GHRQ01012493.1~~GHRQ01012493.1.p2  ORF type:complete len:142 (-),score=19.25 GHRQ01012493.1:307-732(-)
MIWLDQLTQGTVCIWQEILSSDFCAPAGSACWKDLDEPHMSCGQCLTASLHQKQHEQRQSSRSSCMCHALQHALLRHVTTAMQHFQFFCLAITTSFMQPRHAISPLIQFQAGWCLVARALQLQQGRAPSPLPVVFYCCLAT